MKLMIRCKEKLGDHITSYSELGYAVWGKTGRLMVNIVVASAQFGFCIAYFLFSGSQLEQVVCLETQ